MLYDYIFAFIDAGKKKDKKEMDRIRKNLEKLGMDQATLYVLVKEFLEKGINTPEDLVKLEEK